MKLLIFVAAAALLAFPISACNKGEEQAKAEEARREAQAKIAEAEREGNEKKAEAEREAAEVRAKADAAKIDGIVGPETRQALMDALSRDSATPASS